MDPTDNDKTSEGSPADTLHIVTLTLMYVHDADSDPDYDYPAMVISDHGYTTGFCPVAEEAVDDILNFIDCLTPLDEFKALQAARGASLDRRASASPDLPTSVIWRMTGKERS